MRSALLTLHKYAGLSLGLLLSVVGISGSLLVFDHAIDEVLAPATVTAHEAGARAPLAAVLAAARGAVGEEFSAYRISTARRPGIAGGA